MDIAIYGFDMRVSAFSSRANAAERADTLKKETASARTDRLELSAPPSMQKSDILSQMQRSEQLRHEMKQRSEAARQESEQKQLEARRALLCFQIAMRIAAGDQVPPEDEKYLMDHDLKLYTLVMKTRIQKEDPEEHESLLDEADRLDKRNDRGDAAQVDPLFPAASFDQGASEAGAIT